MQIRVKFLFAVTLVSLIFGTGLFYLFERGANDAVTSMFDALWWWIVTTTTVGYGDVVPQTTAGRVIAIFSTLIGFYVYANIIAVIAESVHNYLERDRLGTADVTVTDHIVMCDYTAIADEMIQSIRALPDWRETPIAVVTDLIQVRPYPDCHFVRGVPFSPDALRRANVEAAKYVFIFANFRFADPDLKTLHVASRVLEINPDATILVEMVDPQNELLELAPGRIVPMDSRELIERVLKRAPMDPERWLRSAGAPATS